MSQIDDICTWCGKYVMCNNYQNYCNILRIVDFMKLFLEHQKMKSSSFRLSTKNKIT